MPKAKPMLLNPAKRRKAEIEARIEAELSLAPVTELPEDPPQLKGHAYALACYRRLMGLYSETIAEIVTAFDLDVLCEYCLALQELYEVRAMRDSAFGLWRDIERRIKAKGKKNFGELVGDAAYLIEKATALDSRLDNKSNRCQKLRSSLYLTPVARAGRVPPKKPHEPEADEMDALLNDAKKAANGV